MIRRVALAEAERVKLLGMAQADVDAHRLKVLATAEADVKREPKLLGPGVELQRALAAPYAVEEPNFEQRLTQRVEVREVRRQQNLESIALGAVEAINEEATIDPQPVDEDWIARFFESAQEVSSRDLQAIWSKLLASEVAKPGCVSMRTLEVLRNMSAHESRTFNAYIPYLCGENEDVFLPGVRVALRHYHLLEECGLVGSETRWSLRDGIGARWKHAGLLIEFRLRKSNMGLPFFLSGFKLTSAGKSIARVAGMPARASKPLLAAIQEAHGDHFLIDVAHSGDDQRTPLADYVQSLP